MRPWTRAQLREISTAIIERGITLERLAENSGVGESLIVEIMQGKLRPTQQIRKDLATALGIDPSQIQ